MLHFSIAVRQNSYGSTGYIGSLGPYRNDGSGQSEEDEMGSFTDYGSIVGSFPPSPAGSFRSAIDAPGFSRYSLIYTVIQFNSGLNDVIQNHTDLERGRGRRLPPSCLSVRIARAPATRRRSTLASKKNSREIDYVILKKRKMRIMVGGRGNDD